MRLHEVDHGDHHGVGEIRVRGQPGRVRPSRAVEDRPCALQQLVRRLEARRIQDPPFRRADQLLGLCEVLAQGAEETAQDRFGQGVRVENEGQGRVRSGPAEALSWIIVAARGLTHRSLASNRHSGAPSVPVTDSFGSARVPVGSQRMSVPFQRASSDG